METAFLRSVGPKPPVAGASVYLVAVESPCEILWRFVPKRAITNRSAFRADQEVVIATARFDLGRIVATPGALEALELSGESPATFLARHVVGDWGDLDEDDRAENELSIREGFRILSAFKLGDGTKIWIITEADRSSTTVLLPSEY